MLFSKDIHNLATVDPDRWVRLVQAIGGSLLSAQVFEDTLAKYIAIIFKIPAGSAHDEAQKILTDTQQQTMGSLVNELKAKVNMSESTASLLKAFVKERNWLVHRLQTEDGAALYGTADRFEKLVARVDDISARSWHLTVSFGRLFVDWAVAQGIPREQIDAATIERLRAMRDDATATPPPPTPRPE